MKENRLIYATDTNSAAYKASVKAQQARVAADRAKGGLAPRTQVPVIPKPIVSQTVDPNTLPGNGWLPTYTPEAPEAPIVPADQPGQLEQTVETITNEQRVENEFQNKKTKSAQDFANGIIKTDPYANYNNLTEWRTYQSQLQQDLINQQQGNVNAVNQIENIDFQANTAKSQSAIAGVYSSMAQGREGVMGSSQPLVAGGFKTRTEAIIAQNKARLNLAQSQRQQAIEGMKRAAEEGDANAEASYKAQLDQAQQDILAEEVQASKLAESAASTAASLANVSKTKQETLTKTFEALGERAVDLTPTDLATMADDANLTMGQITAMQQTAILTASLATKKTQAEYDQTQAIIDKYAAELPTAGMTADQQNWNLYQGLSDDKKTEYMNWLALNKGSTLTKYTDANGVEHTIAYNPISGQSQELQTSDTTMEGGDSGSVSDALNVADGTKAGQCGAFVNDYTGLSMGDSFESKMAQTDPNITTPEAGDVFVMPTKAVNGHAGFIMSVSPDGKTATVKDSNWSENEKVQTHTIPVASMTGFARPKNGTIVDYSDFQTGLSQAGLAAFNKLNSVEKSNVSQLLNGDALVTDLVKSRGVAGNKMMQDLLEKARSVDPTFSVTDQASRFEFKKKWNSTESSVGKFRTSLNTTLGHLADFKMSSDALDNGQIKKLNSIKNILDVETGDPDVLKLRTDIAALGSEIASVYKNGTAPSQEEIRNWEEILATDFSKAQFQGISDEVAKLLSSKITSVRYQYKSTMGKEYDKTVIDPEKRQALIDAGIDPNVIAKENVPTVVDKQAQADQEIDNDYTETVNETVLLNGNPKSNVVKWLEEASRKSPSQPKSTPKWLENF
jgi:hypothetical protein